MVFFVELVASDLGSPKSPSMPPVELFRFALKAISEPSNCQENSWVLNLKSFLGANRNENEKVLKSVKYWMLEFSY